MVTVAATSASPPAPAAASQRDDFLSGCSSSYNYVTATATSSGLRVASSYAVISIISWVLLCSYCCYTFIVRTTTSTSAILGICLFLASMSAPATGRGPSSPIMMLSL